MERHRTHHLSRIRVDIVSHCVLEGPQKVFLEPEMRQLLLFQETHSKLSQRVQRKEADIWIVMARNLADFERWCS
jgi:hypothetical protein